MIAELYEKHPILSWVVLCKGLQIMIYIGWYEQTEFVRTELT